MVENGQRGFIQTPLLILIVIVVSGSIGAGVVLHKQGKLSSLTVNISNTFKTQPKEEATETPPIEESSQVTATPIAEEPQKIINDLQQRIKSLEKGSQAPSQSTQVQPPSQPQADSPLKIARCQAEAREGIDRVVNQALSAYLPIYQKRIDEAHAAWLAAREKQRRAIVETPSDLIGAPPYLQEEARRSVTQSIQPTIDYYANLENQIADEWEQAKREARRLGELQYNSIYLACLNK